VSPRLLRALDLDGLRARGAAARPDGIPVPPDARPAPVAASACARASSHGAHPAAAHAAAAST